MITKTFVLLPMEDDEILQKHSHLTLRSPIMQIMTYQHTTISNHSDHRRSRRDHTRHWCCHQAAVTRGSHCPSSLVICVCVSPTNTLFPSRWKWVKHPMRFLSAFYLPMWNACWDVIYFLTCSISLFFILGDLRSYWINAPQDAWITFIPVLRTFVLLCINHKTKKGASGLPIQGVGFSNGAWLLVSGMCDFETLIGFPGEKNGQDGVGPEDGFRKLRRSRVGLWYII